MRLLILVEWEVASGYPPDLPLDRFGNTPLGGPHMGTEWVNDSRSYWLVRAWPDPLTVTVRGIRKSSALFPLEGKLGFFIQPWLHVLAEGCQYDVVLAYGTYAGLFGGLLKAELGWEIPLIVCDIEFPFVYEQRRNRHQLFRAAFEQIDALVTHSHRHQRFYAETGLYSPERVKWVTIGLDCEYFQPIHADLSGPDVVAFGNANRDYPTLIRAVEETELQTVIVSRHFHPTAPLPSNVQFVPGLPLSEMVQLIQRARVVALPLGAGEHSYGQLSTLLALALEKPLVVTRADCIEPYVREGIDALMVEQGHPAQLHSALIRLLGDEFLRRSLAEEGRRHTAANHSTHVLGQQLYAISRSIL